MTTATETAEAGCRVCGVRTSTNLVPEQVRGFDGALQVVPGRYRSGLCPDCLTLRPDEPGSAVRAAISLLGKDEADWPLAARAFEDAGVDVSRLLYGEGREPQRKPWQHVPKAFTADLRRAYVRVLDHRVHAAADHDRPVPPHPPDPEFPQACLACGVGRSVQWHGPVTTTALTQGPGMVTGVVCGACVEHLTAAGAVGAPFLERAVMAHFGKHWSEAVRLPRLRAWVGLDLAPQDEPWSWVEELVEPEPEMDPIVALRADVAALTARVAELEGRA